jgi:hypothetical protein
MIAGAHTKIGSSGLRRATGDRNSPWKMIVFANPINYAKEEQHNNDEM